MPATPLFCFIGKSVAPCRRPDTRPVTMERISVSLLSLARARSSHRANRSCQNPAPAAAAAWAESRTAWHPRRDTKTLFPIHPLKSVLVSRPLAGLFSILHARALFPPRSVPNCKQTGIGKGGAVAPPNSFDHESQNCPGQGKAENGRRRRAIFHTGARRGLVLARNAPSIVQPVCACQCIARPVPSALHIDSARQAWGLCL